MVVFLAEVYSDNYLTLWKLVKYIIRCSVGEWFSGYAFIDVGRVQANVQFWFGLAGQTVFLTMTKPMINGVVWSTGLGDNCCLHFCKLLLDVLAQAYMESFLMGHLGHSLWYGTPWNLPKPCKQSENNLLRCCLVWHNYGTCIRLWQIVKWWCTVIFLTDCMHLYLWTWLIMNVASLGSFI